MTLQDFFSFCSFCHLSKISFIPSLSPLRKQTIIESASTSPIDENPPALPPKRQRVNSSKTASIICTPPSSPKLAQTENTSSSHNRDSNLNTTNKLIADDRSIITRNNDGAVQTVNTVKLDSKDKRKSDGDSNSYIQLYDGQTVKSLSNHTNNDEDEVVLRHNSPNKQQVCSYIKLTVNILMA